MTVQINPDNIIPDAALITPNVPDNESVGALEGQAGVSGGAATYSIPIAVPPGRAGMQPSVALSYSSRAGNGVAGVGWSLSAGSSIHRCGMTAAQDSYGLGVTYNASTDKLCLDGQRLISVGSAGYGQHSAEYRTELDSFVKVVQNNSINSSAATFTVHHKNGQVSTYGGGYNASQKATGRSEILTWAIHDTRDPSGNTINYRYNSHGNGEYTLSQIDYTGYNGSEGNRYVRFTYGDGTGNGTGTRSDQSLAYLAGGRSAKTKLLESITTHYQNEQVRSYQLAYKTSATSQRAIVDSITECAFDENGSEACLPSTSFSTYKPALAWESVDSTNANQSEIGNFGELEGDDKILMKDLNGDGVAEALYLDRKSDNTFDVRVYTLNSSGDYVEETGADLYNNDVHVYGGIEGDINGDGITDFITNINSRLVYFQFDNNFKLQTHYTNFYFASNYDRINSGQGVQVADLNGDGYSDIIFTSLGINGDVEAAYYQNSANGNVSFSGPYTLVDMRESNISSDESAFLSDMDGDGVLDLVLTFQATPTNVTVSIAYGSHYNGRIRTTRYSASSLGLPTQNAYNQFTWADLNGDGLKDFVRAVERSSGVYEWAVRINQGNRTFASEQYLGTSLGIHKQEMSGHLRNERFFKVQAKFGGLQVADLDNDGKEEFLVATTSNDQYCVIATGFEDITNGDMAMIQACNDDIHKYEHENMENPGEKFRINLSLFDLRRFKWSLVDFKVESSSIKYQRTISNVAEAPIQSSVLIDGRLADNEENSEFVYSNLQALKIDDFNNDGLADFNFRTLSGYSYNGKFSMSGRMFKGAIGGSFGGDLVPSGFFVQKNNTAHSIRQQDTLYRVKDGLLNYTYWNYAPISRAQNVNGKPLYTVPSNRESWYTNKDPKREHFYFTSSMPVVASFIQSTGVGGYNYTTYRYKEAIYNRMGRGFQGFRTVIVENPDGTRAVSDFHQIFPLAGKIEKIETCLKADNSDRCSATPLSKTEVGYASVDTTGYDTYWNIAAKSVKTSYELNGRAQTSKTTSYVGLSDPGSISSSMAVTSDEIESKYGNIKLSTSKVDTGFGVNETQTVKTFYTANESSWWIDKLKSSQVKTKAVSQIPSSNAVYSASLDNDKTVTTYIDTYHASRNPTKVRTVPSVGKSIEINSAYNSYGLPTSVTTKADGISRTVSTGYSSDNYFVNSVTNIDGTVYTNSIPQHGQPSSTTDINGFVSYFNYDAFGRVEEVSPPSGTGQPVYTRYAECKEGCDGISNTNLAYKVTTYSAGTPESSVYKDKFNRVLYARTESFDGSYIYNNVTYDKLGRKQFESTPSRNAEGLNGTHFTDYDVLGRLTRKTTDQTESQVLEVEYAYGSNAGSTLVPYRTRIIVNNSRTMYRTHNGVGQLMRTTDANSGVTRYAYDGAGNPIVLQDANGNSITATYNALNQKRWVIDPNMGRKDFTYTGFGEIYSEKDAEQNTYYYRYDGLGRLQHRYLNGTASGNIEATFSYHGSSAECKSLPNQEVRNDLPSGETFMRTFQYDDYCRPNGTVTNVDGDSFTTKIFYDGNYGRVKGKLYPSDLVVAYEYNSLGYQFKTKNALSNTVYRSITAMDDWGNWKQAALGTATNITREFHEETGQMKSSILKRYSSQKQSVTYTGYDSYGNLLGQSMGTYQGSTYYLDSESYGYDSLHRLTRSTLTLSGATQPDVNYGYDKVGNFKFKTDFSTGSTAAYAVGNVNKSIGGNAGPNAVRRVQMINGAYRNFAYDNNGNLENDGVRDIQYNAFNKPIQITIGQNTRIHPSDSSLNSGGTLRFSYGADQMRYKQVKTASGSTTTTIYIDKQYERVTTNGQTTHKSYVDDIAVVSRNEGASSSEVTYFHRDRLGSMIASVNESGYVITGHSYDPFGKPRDQRMRDNASSAVSLNVLNDTKTNRGFTDHEHLDDAQLIHMNGRVYDYNLGRFLSVDPFIQEPGNSQSMNPYSYIMNNPLSGTDPSGYKFSWGDTRKEEIDVGEKSEVLKDKEGNIYVGEKGSDTLTKVETITVTSNGSENTFVKTASDTNSSVANPENIGSSSENNNIVFNANVTSSEQNLTKSKDDKSCKRSSSGDNRSYKNQKKSVSGATGQVVATKEMDQAAISTKGEFFYDDGSPKEIEKALFIGEDNKIKMGTMRCATEDTAVYLPPEDGYAADIHGHPSGLGRELPGPEDYPRTKPRYFWSPTGALRVVEIVNTGDSESPSYKMRVRTVAGGSKRMNRAVSRWKAGMRDRDILKLEERGR